LLQHDTRVRVGCAVLVPVRVGVRCWW
jgi:hypothetical protein